jgi:Ca-activated chloride channel family protein
MRLRISYLRSLGAIAVATAVVSFCTLTPAQAPAQSSSPQNPSGQRSPSQSSPSQPAAAAQSSGTAPAQPVAPAASATQPTTQAPIQNSQPNQPATPAQQQPAGQPDPGQAPNAQPATPTPVQTPEQAQPQQPQPDPSQPPAGQDAVGQPPAQSSTTDDPSRFVFRKQVEEVVLHATVVDAQGRLIPNLEKTAFSIYQNGKFEAVTSFRREDVPVSIGIVVDNSGSMRDKRQKVSQAVLNLISASNPQDESFVVNFGPTPYLDQDFTSDAKLLQTALHQDAARGSTALYDAVVASTVHLQNNPRLDKKVLLVITDGKDNMSRETLREAIRKLQTKKGPTVYAIGLTDQGMTADARQALQSLAAATGGTAFFPESLDEVDAITRTVAHDIRNQYTLAYNPGSTAGRTGYQTIRVEAQAPGQGPLTVRTREGYYMGEKLR